MTHFVAICGDWSNSCRDMASNRFCKMAAVPSTILNLSYASPMNSTYWSLSLCKIWLESMLHFQ